MLWFSLQLSKSNYARAYLNLNFFSCRFSSWSIAGYKGNNVRRIVRYSPRSHSCSSCFMFLSLFRFRVKVAVRVRPFNAREKERQSKLTINMTGATTIISNPDSEYSLICLRKRERENQRFPQKSLKNKLEIELPWNHFLQLLYPKYLSLNGFIKCACASWKLWLKLWAWKDNALVTFVTQKHNFYHNV